MKKSYEYFLELSASLHFTRAAQKLYISQQALSDQISRLEAEIGIPLFIRKPHLRLTPAGEILLDHLKRMQHMERDLDARLSILNDIKTGEIRIGMHNARASIIMAGILTGFNSEYPNVRIEIVSDQTRNYSSLLRDGAIDFFLGINAIQEKTKDLVYDVIGYEPLYLVIHSTALQRLWGEDYQRRILECYEGADLDLFKDVPFIFAGEISHGQQSINRYLSQKGIRIQPKIVYNDYSAQYKMLSNISGACFTYRMMLPSIREYNENSLSKGRLYYFPLVDFNEYLELSLVRYQDSYFYPFTKRLYDLIRNSCFENIVKPAAIKDERLNFHETPDN